MLKLLAIECVNIGINKINKMLQSHKNLEKIRQNLRGDTAKGTEGETTKCPK